MDDWHFRGARGKTGAKEEKNSWFAEQAMFFLFFLKMLDESVCGHVSIFERCDTPRPTPKSRRPKGSGL